MAYLLIRKAQEANGSDLVLNDKDQTLFWVAFSTSIITSALGLAKNLKVGPCRILPEQKKLLGGLLSPRFILIFFSCGLILVAKGLALALGVSTSSGKVSAALAVITLSTIFLPGFLIGLFACWHRGILKTFLAHPSVFLLPVFSIFTFVSKTTKVCSGAEEKTGEKGLKEATDEQFITFSPKYTAINGGISVAGLLACFLTRPVTDHSEPDSLLVSGQMLFMVAVPFIAGLLLSLAAALSNQCKCCKSCCCCLCCTEPFEMGALLTSSLHTPYVLGLDGQLNKEKTGGGQEEVDKAEKETVEDQVEDVEAFKMDESQDLS